MSTPVLSEIKQFSLPTPSVPCSLTVFDPDQLGIQPSAQVEAFQKSAQPLQNSFSEDTVKLIAGILSKCHDYYKVNVCVQVYISSIVCARYQMTHLLVRSVVPSIAQLVERWTVVWWLSIGRWFESGSKDRIVYFFSLSLLLIFLLGHNFSFFYILDCMHYVC